MTEEEKFAIEATFGCEATAHEELGLTLIRLAKIQLPDGCTPECALAIFVRGTLNGYSTRLFFDRPILPANGKTYNQHIHPLLGRPMYAHSINSIPATLPPHQAILAHLRMYERN
jgi:hypothetical protein